MRCELTPVHFSILLGDRKRNTKLSQKSSGGIHTIYELRVYHCLPGRLPSLLKRFETATIRLFEKHGIRQFGFWTVSIGESNQDLVYILQWDSMADREKRFASFQSDPEWIEARRKSEEDGPLVASITNSILTPTAFSAAR